VYEALFALAGTALGIVGTLLADLVRARKDDRRYRREQLRSACVDLTTALVKIRQAYWGRAYGEEEAGRRAALQRAHDAARANYERLRLSTSSLAVQEQARFALRYAYGLLRQFEGLPPRPDELEVGPIDQLDDAWSGCTRRSGGSWAPPIQSGSSPSGPSSVPCRPERPLTDHSGRRQPPEPFVGQAFIRVVDHGACCDSGRRIDARPGGWRVSSMECWATDTAGTRASAWVRRTVRSRCWVGSITRRRLLGQSSGSSEPTRRTTPRPYLASSSSCNTA
jgi:hypothetical protein